MEEKTNYTIVGVIVLLLSVGLISAVLWLSVGFNQKEYHFYTVYLHESAAGLNEESPVKFNGVQVGFVKQIRLNKTDPRQVELTLSVEQGTPITTSTTATLISQGITGVAYVGLSAASSNLTPLRAMPGEPYPVIPAKPSLFGQLDAMLKEVSENVNKLSAQAEHIFNEENAKSIRHSLENLDKLSSVFANNANNINHSINSADVFLANMAKVSQQMPNIMSDLKAGVTHFNALTQDLSTAGKDISSTMVAGKHTLDKFSQQTIPPAVILLRRLNSIAANLEKVSSEMRQNPSVVVRGTAAPQPGPGE